MTAQFNDVFRYQNKEFAVAGISAGELFEPAIFGLHPIPASTACWRGYVAAYAISNSHLVLDELSVNLQERPGPAINGVVPEEATGRFGLFNNLYRNLNYRFNYTGGLLIADEFIHELYVHMGFHPAWKYKTVFELIFADGRLTGEFDRSERMAQLRQRIQESGGQDKPPKMPTEKEISDFVERSFNRTYTRGE
jgi:hypothetical protein